MLSGHFYDFFWDFGETKSIRFVRAERDKVS